MSLMLASPRPFGAEIQVLHVHLRGDLVASGLGGEAQLGLRRTRAVPRQAKTGARRRGGNHRDTGPAGERVARAAGRKTNLSCY